MAFKSQEHGQGDALCLLNLSKYEPGKILSFFLKHMAFWIYL